MTDTQINNSVQEAPVAQEKPVEPKPEVKPEPVVQPTPQPQPKQVQTVTTPSIAVAGGKCNTGNPYKDYIYYKESTCNPAAVNHIGCRGIGQACPGSKLPCGADFACQDAWFSNYAIQRYGSWENAYAFWLQNHWW